MLGLNLKGVGQSTLAVRKKPYPNKRTPKVAASEMMNNQIVSFLEGIA
jgi:hypothetical protein